MLAFCKILYFYCLFGVILLFNMNKREYKVNRNQYLIVFHVKFIQEIIYFFFLCIFPVFVMNKMITRSDIFVNHLICTHGNWKSNQNSNYFHRLIRLSRAKMSAFTHPIKSYAIISNFNLFCSPSGGKRCDNFNRWIFGSVNIRSDLLSIN